MQCRRNCLITGLVIQVLLVLILLALRDPGQPDTDEVEKHSNIQSIGGLSPPLSLPRRGVHAPQEDDKEAKDIQHDYDFGENPSSPVPPNAALRMSTEGHNVSPKSRGGLGHHKVTDSTPEVKDSTEKGGMFRSHKSTTASPAFDMRRAVKSFSVASSNPQVSIDEFIEGYQEICKYLESFGMVFHFTMSDVREKLKILSEYRSSSDGSHYSTVEGMLEYEIGKKITVSKKKPSGSRTLLRLQRAMEFIAGFMERIADADPATKAGPIALAVYKDTLSKHHEWLVRTGVQIGMRTLPNAGVLVDRMGLDNHELRVKVLKDISEILRPMDERMHEMYKARDLLQLP